MSTPGSASYRHFLTPAQYRARYEPTAAAVASVSAWLRSAGLRITGVEASHRYVSAGGSVAAAERAFGAKLNVYRHAGTLVRAPSSNARVPAGVAGSVLGVTGLSTAPEFSRPQIGPPPAGFRNARPCSKSYGTIPATVQADGTTPLPTFQGKVRDYAVCGYTPRQYRGAYGVSATGLTGKGQTIGIVDAFAAGTILKDANTYARRHGDRPFGKGQFTQNMPRTFHLHPTQCQTPADWAGEETLDVEAAHGMATKAHVIYYGAQSCLNQDLQFALGRVDDQNKVSVVSNSYGGPTVGETAGDIAAWEQVILQGEMQGITFLFSSGDNGDWQALPRVQGHRLSGLRPVRDRRRRHQPRRSGRRTSCSGRQAGAPTSSASRPTARAGRRSRPIPSCTEPAAASRPCSRGRATRTASSTAARGGRIPMSRSTPIRRPACWSGRRRSSRRA